MPPAISDDEVDSDGVDVPDSIPAKGKITKAAEPEYEAEEEEDDEDEPDEFIVEKILKHDFTDEGVPLYQIKWLGYQKKADLTWEPVENLENAADVLKAYHHMIGGPPNADPKPTSTKKKGAKGGKRSASAAFANTDSPTVAPKKRGRKSAGDAANGTSHSKSERELPEGSWEEHVLRVTSIIEETDAPKKGQAKGSLVGLLEWNDGSKTQHNLSALRRKCPQKVLDFYEQHLVFTNKGADG